MRLYTPKTEEIRACLEVPTLWHFLKQSPKSHFNHENRTIPWYYCFLLQYSGIIIRYHLDWLTIAAAQHDAKCIGCKLLLEHPWLKGTIIIVIPGKWWTYTLWKLWIILLFGNVFLSYNLSTYTPINVWLIISILWLDNQSWS